LQKVNPHTQPVLEQLGAMLISTARSQVNSHIALLGTPKKSVFTEKRVEFREKSEFLSMTIFIPAEHTRHSEKPGQNLEIKCMVTHLNREDVQFSEILCGKWQNQFTENLF
jgi:hypothetical protein